MKYTLGIYRRLAAECYGEDSDAVRFFDRKIAESPQGRDEPVLADQSQMLALLGSFTAAGKKL